MSQTAVELPRYQCHKQVHAAKIQAMRLSETEGKTVLIFESPPNSSVEVFDMWCDKHKVKIGDYYVQYNDGYTSCSPAKAFEEGYILLSDDTASTTVSLGVAVDDYKTRVRQEHSQLVAKITKLEAYLEPLQPPPAPQPYETRVLFDQLDAMRRYRDILALRIHNF